MVRNCEPVDPRAVMAWRAIRETEAFLLEGLLHPESAMRIPAVRVGYGTFPPGLAEEFWRRALALDAA